MAATFDLFKQYGEWHWALKHSNGSVLARSAKGYSEKRKAKRAISSVVGALLVAELREVRESV
jgi:uncharacterized protein YegP (UPF0339 family)